MDEFEVLPTTEIIARVVAGPLNFKIAAPVLEARRPDDEAGRALIAAFETGRAPAWLTAYYLGCLRALSGYPTLKRILTEAPGHLAESYAGVAMVRVAGTAARDDLLEVLRSAPEGKSRQGALFGLAELRDASTAAAILGALEERKVPAAIVGSVLGRFDVSSEEFIGWIRSGNERTRAAAIRAVILRAAEPGGLGDRAIAMATRQAIDSGRVHLSPRTRTSLEASISAVLGR